MGGLLNLSPLPSAQGLHTRLSPKGQAVFSFRTISLLAVLLEKSVGIQLAPTSNVSNAGMNSTVDGRRHCVSAGNHLGIIIAEAARPGQLIFRVYCGELFSHVEMTAA